MDSGISRNILGTLYQSKSWINARALSVLLKVSERTIRNYIKNINQSHQGKLIISSELGYRLDPLVSHKDFENILHQLTMDVPFNRQHFIIRKLCLHNTYINLTTFEDELFISTTTLENDLKAVKSILEEHQINLERKDNSVRIEADESTRRKMITYLFYEEKKQYFVNLDILEKAFNVELSDFYQEFIAILDHYRLYLNEYAIGNVLVHILISIERIKNDMTLEFSVDENLLGSQEFIASESISRKILDKFSVKYTESEIGYLAMLIYSRSNQVFDEKKPIEDDLSNLIEDIIHYVEDAYLIDLRDSEFLNRFSVHITNLIHRANYNSLNKNPLTNYIKEMYPLTYDLSVFISQIIEKHIKQIINEDEIAYIAFHIAAFLEPKKEPRNKLIAAIYCPDFHLLRNDLINKLTDHFETYIKRFTFLVSMNEDFSNVEADLIITTVPLDHFISIPTVTVAPVIRQHDLDSIYKMIVTINGQLKFTDTKSTLFSLFDSRFFRINVPYKDEWETINNISNELNQFGFVDDEFEQSVYERERMSTTAFNNIIAIPHSMKMVAKKSAVYIIINNQPIKWGNTDVKLIALFAINKEDKRLFVDMYDDFIGILSEVDNVNKILKSKDFDSFLSILSDLIS